MLRGARGLLRGRLGRVGVMAAGALLEAGIEAARRRRASRAAGGAGAPGGGRYRSGEEYRDDVLRRYPFTPAARKLLKDVRFEVKHLDEPRGGGLWFGPKAKRIVLEGVQDEAAVHELAHAWADLAGFYREQKPGGPAWPVLHRTFRTAVRAAADGEAGDERFARVRRIARQYEYGDPAINFGGMGENDPERFAGLASGTMGDLSKMPPGLARFYERLFASRK